MQNLPLHQGKSISQEEEIPDFEISFTEVGEVSKPDGTTGCLTQGVNFFNKSNRPIYIELYYINQSGEKFSVPSGFLSPNSSTMISEDLGVLQLYHGTVGFALPFSAAASFQEESGFDLYYPVVHPCDGFLGVYVSEGVTQPTSSPKPTSTKVPTNPIPTTESILTGNVSATLGCYTKIESNEENVCTVNIFPDEALSEIVFEVAWYIDGNWAFTSTNQSVTIPPLPPGLHEISVVIGSTETVATARASAVTEVIDSGVVAPPSHPPSESGSQNPPTSSSESDNNLFAQTGQVSPVGQAASAIGSLVMLAAWLWLEYRNNSQGYERNQQRIAQQVEGENADRRDWFGQRSAENQDFRNQQLINQGYVFNTELGGWVPGPGHPDYEASQNRLRLEALAARLRNLIRLLPPNRQVNLSELLDSITFDRGMDEGALVELNRLRNAIYQQIQGQNESGQAVAEMDQVDAESNLGWAENVQWMNNSAGGMVILGTLVFNPAALADASSRLAAIQLVGNFTSGAAGGYIEGGFQTAGIRIAQNILPINTISSLFNSERTWGETKWDVVRDFCNVMNLVEGGSYIQQHLVSGTSGGIGNIVDDIARSGDDIISAGRSSVDDIARSGDDIISAGHSSADDIARSGDDIVSAGRSSADDIARSGDDIVSAGRSSADDIARSGDDVITSQQQQINNQWQQQRIIGEQQVESFNQLVNEYNDLLTPPARRVELEGLMHQSVSEIRGNYQATNIIKYSNNPSLQQAFNTELGRIYNQVDLDFVENLNRQGVRIGGRPVSIDDFTDIRNNASAGSVGMDRDLAQNQQLIQSIKDRLNQATPGSQEASDLQNYYQYVHNQSQISINGQQVSNANANEFFQRTYNNSFQRVTGQNADDAMQMVTFDQHVEAYADLNALKNSPAEIPFQPSHAAQTASVNMGKFNNLINQVKNGQISEGYAIQEIFRGTAKEITNKIEPLMRANASVPAEKLERLLELRDYLSEVGKGNIPPGDAIARFQNWMDLPNQISAQFEALIKY
ncbi:MAG: hypothetical protein IH585_15195 [Anaerolineaceae bacterium]|nr:hypothetical protein [Anaerolineaceae bacterium]